MSQPMKRTTQRDPNSPHNIRSGTPTRSELGVDFESYQQRLEQLLAGLHGAGIATGLDVSGTQHASGLVITPGVAIDGDGRVIALAEGGYAEIGASPDAPGATPTLVPVKSDSIQLPTDGLSGSKLLVIRWWETLDTDAFNNTVAYQMDHTPWLQFTDMPATLDLQISTLVPLAAVNFGTGADAGMVNSVIGLFYRQTLPLQRELTFSGPSTSSTVSTGGPQPSSVSLRSADLGLKLSVPNKKKELSLIASEHSWDLGATGFTSNPAIRMSGWVVLSDRLQILSEDGSSSGMDVDLGNKRVTVFGNLEVTGTANAHAGKVGYVVDVFRNASPITLERGTVVVLAGHPSRSDAAPDTPVAEVQSASSPYDRRVCGVVSKGAAPGEQGMLVTLGCWGYCLVDADLAPVEAADLLTTSSTPGHAQKLTDYASATGAVIGKALAPLASGRGTVPVLATLH